MKKIKTKKRRPAKKEAPTMLYVGPKPEAVRQMRDAMIAILKTKAEPSVHIEAVRSIAKLGEIGPLTISGCTFLGHGE